jgi:hypothetical protein
MKVHLIPIACERTWESKENKKIQIFGISYKRQVTIVISLTIDANLLLLRAVFKNYQTILR